MTMWLSQDRLVLEYLRLYLEALLQVESLAVQVLLGLWVPFLILRHGLATNLVLLKGPGIRM